MSLKAAACPLSSCKAPPRAPCVDHEGNPATWIHVARIAASLKIEEENPCECFRKPSEPHAGFCPAGIWE